MLEFSFEALEESAVAFRRIENFLRRVEEITDSLPERRISPTFATLMNDDLAVPQALALISEWLKAGNMAINANDISAMSSAASEIRGALDILGCDPFDDVFAVTSKRPDQAIDGLIALLLEQREAARLRKDFAAADAIRDRIAGLGITIEDTEIGRAHV